MKRTKAIVSLAVLALILLMSIAAPWIAPYDPTKMDMSATMAPPSAKHWLGTDTLGRDLFSRVLYGGRASILLALVATFCSMMVGLLIGMVSGYFGGAVDWIFNVLASIMQGIPNVCFMVALAGIMSNGSRSILLGVVLTSWVGFSRVVRSEVMRLRRESYVDSAKTAGAGHFRILFSDILPNIMGNIAVLFTTRLGSVILSVAALSYLGLGISAPTPDWGIMINDARSYFRSAPLLAIAPGTCIFLLSVSINLLGDCLRDKMNVRAAGIAQNRN